MPSSIYRVSIGRIGTRLWSENCVNFNIWSVPLHLMERYCKPESGSMEKIAELPRHWTQYGKK